MFPVFKWSVLPLQSTLLTLHKVLMKRNKRGTYICINWTKNLEGQSRYQILAFFWIKDLVRSLDRLTMCNHLVC